jgi:3-hydroxy-9,10-secoandrosta-1,3,5(10)-triene-9,17-dione monooxygenase
MADTVRRPKTTAASKSGDDDAYAAMIARAHALVPQLRERASRTEELRHLPPETERDLHEAGLFRILQPKRVGGSEFDYVALVDFADVIGRADASVAWNLVNLASHHWMLGMFDPSAQDLIWNKDPDALIASSFVFPAGRAKKVDGGYQVRGRWPFSSGVDSSEWNMLAAIVSSDDEADGIEYRIFCSTRTTTRLSIPGMRAA